MSLLYESMHAYFFNIIGLGLGQLKKKILGCWAGKKPMKSHCFIVW